MTLSLTKRLVGCSLFLTCEDPQRYFHKGKATILQLPFGADAKMAVILREESNAAHGGVVAGN